MPDNGFGSNLWKNMQAVKFGRNGGIEAPVRANGRDGIVFGVDAIAKSKSSPTAAGPTAAGPAKRGALRELWQRMRRR